MIRPTLINSSRSIFVRYGLRHIHISVCLACRTSFIIVSEWAIRSIKNRIYTSRISWGVPGLSFQCNQSSGTRPTISRIFSSVKIRLKPCLLPPAASLVAIIHDPWYGWKGRSHVFANLPMRNGKIRKSMIDEPKFLIPYQHIRIPDRAVYICQKSIEPYDLWGDLGSTRLTTGSKVKAPDKKCNPRLSPWLACSKSCISSSPSDRPKASSRFRKTNSGTWKPKQRAISPPINSASRLLSHVRLPGT